MKISRHKFSPPFVSGIFVWSLYFTINGEKIYIEKSKKVNKINEFGNLTSIYYPYFMGGIQAKCELFIITEEDEWI